MKTLYLDCGMGAAGDMLTGALLELLPDPDGFLARLNAVGIPGVEVKKYRAEKCGVVGTGVSVLVHGEEEAEEPHAHSHGHTHDHAHENEHDHDHDHGHGHAHRGMDEIRHIVCEHMRLPEKTAADVLQVYETIAAAESRVHGVPVSEIHFHEVGMLDAIADITAVCLLMNELSPDEVVVSPVHVGSGQVRCAHGILPVPAPATALILQGAPIYGGSVKGELCTPTGAALLKHFAARFGEMPAMTVERVGYGMGKKDFEAANCVRAMLGETASEPEAVIELSCNVDDMTGEELGFAMERLFEGGAKEVFTVPVGMKKSRPGTMLCVICTARDRDAVLALLFKHTSTLGVREKPVKRHVLHREIRLVHTQYGEMRKKVASGYGVKKEKYEYEDLARAARETGLSINEIKNSIKETN